MTTAVTPKAKNHAGLGQLDSRVVRPDDMEWEPIKYPGCYVKTLMVDRKNGQLTVLLKMDPGATQSAPASSSFGPPAAAMRPARPKAA